MHRIHTVIPLYSVLTSRSRINPGSEGYLGDFLLSDQQSGPETQFASLFANLMAPFAPEQVEHRDQGGVQLSYIDATTAANRLDDVVGPERWAFEIKPWGDAALIGTLKLTMPDGTVVSKSSVGAKPVMKNAGPDDEFKAADSDCFKRCCDRMGIGRYLRQSGLPGFVMAELGMSSQDLAVLDGSGRGQSSRPASPPPGRPAQTQGQTRPANPPQGQPRQYDDTRCPGSGKGLFAWCMKKQKDEGVEGVVEFINNFGKQMSFPARMIDWNADEVKEAWDAYHGQA